MKRNLILICLFVFTLAQMSCRKEELGLKLPRVRAFVITDFGSDLTPSSFTASGKVDDGKAGSIQERGFCWSLNDNPDISNSQKVTATPGTGEFKATISGLTPDTEYYFRAYAINPHGVWYGEVRKQKTFPGSWPSVKTHSGVDMGGLQVRITGEVLDDGGYPETVRGICYVRDGFSFPDTSDLKVLCGNGLGQFDTLITLPQDGTWSFRAFAWNSKGVSYGERVELTVSTVTGATVPVVQTDSIDFLSSMSIGINGTILSNGGSPVTATGFCYSTSPNPDILTGTVQTNVSVFTNFSAILSVTGNTTYYIRAFATNVIGTGYGNEVTVTTPP